MSTTTPSLGTYQPPDSSWLQAQALDRIATCVEKYLAILEREEKRKYFSFNPMVD